MRTTHQARLILQKSFLLVELRSQFVAFFSCRFQIKHQVLNVEPQLGKRFLNQIENPPPPPYAIDDLVVAGLQFAPNRVRHRVNSTSQIEQFARKFHRISIIKTRFG